MWVGSGLQGVDGLAPGDMLTAEQMRHLFANGLHPLAAQREQQARAAGATDDEATVARRLGTPFRVPKKPSAFLTEVARRVATEVPAGTAPNEAAEARATITSEVAKEWFRVIGAGHPRMPGS